MQNWGAPLDFDDEKAAKSKKLHWHVPAGIDSFISFVTIAFPGWEIAFFNGKPARELSLCVDFGDGFYHRGYVDLVLYHPDRNVFMVVECKTTRNQFTAEAEWGNSTQALGYSVVLDSIAEQMGVVLGSTYEVMYLIYHTLDYRWEPMPFRKSFLQRAEWIQDVFADIELIRVFGRLDYWPKHGNACYSWGRECELYGTCGLNISHIVGVQDIQDIPEPDEWNQPWDFKFRVDDLIAHQLKKAGIDPVTASRGEA